MPRHRKRIKNDGDQVSDRNKPQQNMARCSETKISESNLLVKYSDIALPCMLQPSAFRRREMVVQKMKERLKKQVEIAFEELQGLFSKTKCKKKAFWDWCLSHAQTEYPGLGDYVAYSVPHFFIGRQDIQDQKDTGLFTHIQESQIRGDEALCRVGRAFRLLSNKREKERLKEKNSGSVQYPFFIMGTILNEHILKWPDRVLDVYPDIGPFPDMAKCPGKEFEPYYIQPTENNVRGDIDLMVLDRHAHVILLEVKAIGTYPAQTKEEEEIDGERKKKNKWQESYDQLQTARNNFKKMFPEIEFKDIKICCVIAMPNITLSDAEDQFHFNSEELKKELVYMLTKEDMITETMKEADSEYDLLKLEQWWKEHNLSEFTTELSPDLMKIIVTRYIGTLSRPLGMELNQQRNHIRTPCDAIEFASTTYKSLCFLFNEDVAKQEEQTARNILKYGKENDGLNTGLYRRSHLKGPSGSRRTTMTIIKAKHFLCKSIIKDSSTSAATHDKKTSSKSKKTKKEPKNSKDSTKMIPDGSRHVIIVDIYRGCQGRPAGMHLYKTITETVSSPTKIVHHLPLDGNDITVERFHEMVKSIQQKFDILPDNLMFIVDEIPPLQLWEKVLIALEHEDYQKCHVWITDGLMSENLKEHEEKFHQIILTSMCRIPPSILKVLYHVDWREDKEKIYTTYKCGEGIQQTVSDPQQSLNTTTLHTKICWSTQGPIPLCIRHQLHEARDILRCTDCATELAELVFKLKIVEKNRELAAAAKDDAVLQCSIILLFAIPLDQYKSSVDEFHVEITASNYEKYADEIDKSPFIASLRNCLPSSVHVVTKLEEDEEPVSRPEDPNEKQLNKIRLCWTDRFQGLVSDVVIFLPSGKKDQADLKQRLSFDGKASRPLPYPGTVPDLKEVPQDTRHKDSNETVSMLMEHACTSVSSPASDEKTQEPRRGDKSDIELAFACQLADLYWSTKDIERYSEWDKTQLMIAGTRCTGQLILIVP